MRGDDRRPRPHGRAGAAVPATLADVIAKIQAHPDLPPRRQRDLVSAIRTVSKGLSLDPALVAADPRSLRKRFEQLSPALLGVSRGRFTNLRSLVVTAVAMAGVKMMPGRAREPLSPEWEALRALLPDRYDRWKLGRFMYYCSVGNIVPAEVNEATFSNFQQALENDSIVKRPVSVFRETCLVWNRAAGAIPGWPALVVPVPNRRRRYALDFSDFPPNFGSDAEAFLNRLGNQDPLADDYARSARPITVRHRRQMLLQVATALAISGHDRDKITSLAVLTEIANFKTAIRFFLDRAGGKTTERIHHIASFLKSMARHRTRPGEPVLREIALICTRLAPGKRGMTPRNRERLRQFDDHVNAAALLDLPNELANEARAMMRDHDGRNAALRMMCALAIALLSNVPLRAENLSGLRLDRHFVRSRPGANGVVHLVIPAHEMKTDETYEAELSQSLKSLLDEYIAKSHPLLSSRPSPWLFANEEGKRRNTGGFARQIAALIKDETGLTVNVHLFRHLSVKLWLQENPEDIETPRRVLGHRSVNTTVRAYSEMRSVDAIRRYDQLITRLRDRTPDDEAAR